VRDPLIDVLGEDVGKDVTTEEQVVKEAPVEETTEEQVQVTTEKTTEDIPAIEGMSPEDKQKLEDIESGKVAYFAAQKWAYDLKIEGFRAMKKPELIKAIRGKFTVKKQLQEQ